MRVAVDRPSRAEPRIFDARALLRYFDPECEDDAIAGALGIGRKTVGKWRRDERYLVSAYRADRLATRLGTHPCLVWGRLWWTSVEIEERA